MDGQTEQPQRNVVAQIVITAEAEVVKATDVAESTEEDDA